MNDNTPTFIEKLRHQIKEEQRRYRNALNSNKEYFELRLIKNNIERLQRNLQHLMNKIREYVPKSS